MSANARSQRSAGIKTARTMYLLGAEAGFPHCVIRNDRDRLLVESRLELFEGKGELQDGDVGTRGDSRGAAG